jgi:hypothetical protein
MTAPARQGQGDNCARPAQVRQGQCNNGVTTEATRERETARRWHTSMIDTGGARGYNGGAALK